MVNEVDEFSELRQRRRAVLGRLALRFLRGYQETVRTRAYVGHEVLSPAHSRVLIHLDHEGTRASELAERVRVSKQAMSVLLRHLERHGYVERRPDPSDGRAQLVHFTPSGRAFLELALAELEAMDAEIVSKLGPERADLFRSCLAELAEDFDPGGF